MPDTTAPKISDETRSGESARDIPARKAGADDTETCAQSAAAHSSPDSVDRHISPWTFRQKLGRAAWSGVERTLFRCSPRLMYGWRAFLLRLFGARLGAKVRIRPSVTIEVPWHLTIGDSTAVGDHAILYCLGPVTVGKRVTISQYAHLCAGTHDYTRADMPLLRPPITVGDDVWIAADAFIGPGVTIGDRTIVGARSSVFQDLPPDMICAGNPAQPIRRRPASKPT